MSKIKECFHSRWEGGLVAELDFSQLEMFVLGHLTQDPVLLADLRKGTDMHCQMASFLYGSDYHVIKAAVTTGDPYWSLRRKIAKGPAFLMNYGGGAKLMSEKNDLTKRECQAFIDNYYNRYRGVKKWQDDQFAIVKRNRVRTDTLTKGGYPRGKSFLINECGRRYTFWEYDSPDWAKTTVGFIPTEVKNYPVQGMAADILTVVLAKLYERFMKDDLYDIAKLMNTVHDSIIIDIKERKDLTFVLKCAKYIMEAAPQLLKEWFDIDFELELKVTASYGPTWAEQTEVDV